MIPISPIYDLDKPNNYVDSANNTYEYQQNPKTVFASNIIEFWTPITDKSLPKIIPNRFYISSYGNTWDAAKRRPITTTCTKSTKFYKYIHFTTIDNSHITRKLHRVEMIEFCYFEGCETFEVNHRDGIHWNNYIFNLEWVSSSENRQHSIHTGLEPTIFGKQIIQFTPEEIHNIKVLRDMGLSYNKIIATLGFEERGTNRKTIERICLGKSVLYSKYYY